MSPTQYKQILEIVEDEQNQSYSQSTWQDTPMTDLIVDTPESNKVDTSAGFRTSSNLIDNPQLRPSTSRQGPSTQLNDKPMRVSIICFCLLIIILKIDLIKNIQIWFKFRLKLN